MSEFAKYVRFDGPDDKRSIICWLHVQPFTIPSMIRSYFLGFDDTGTVQQRHEAKDKARLDAVYTLENMVREYRRKLEADFVKEYGHEL